MNDMMRELDRKANTDEAQDKSADDIRREMEAVKDEI